MHQDQSCVNMGMYDTVVSIQELYGLYGEKPFTLSELSDDSRKKLRIQFARSRGLLNHHKKVYLDFAGGNAGSKVWQWKINLQKINMYCKMFNLME